MQKLAKVLLSNIKASIGRSIIIIVTLVIATISLYSTFIFKDFLIENQISKMRETEVGKSNYIITKAEDGDIFKLSNNVGKFAKELGILATGGSIEKNDEVYKFEILGCKIDELKDIFSYKINGGKDDLQKDQAIISKNISNRLNVNVDDNITVYIDGKQFILKVIGIAEDESIFAGNENRILVDKSTLNSKLNIEEGSVNRVYVNSEHNLDEVNDEAKEVYGGETVVKESINYSAINSEVNSYSSILLIILIFVALISTLIIYSTYKTILFKRLPFIGTLKALGINDKKITILHLLEVGVYSLISLFIGIGVASLISGILGKTFEKNILQNEVSHGSIMKSIIVTCLIIFVALQVISILAQKGINKMSIRQLLFDGSISENNNILLSAVGAALFVGIFAISKIINRDKDIVVHSILLITCIITLILFVKCVLTLINKMLMLVKGKGILYASLRNTLSQKVMYRNINLLVIGGMIIMIIGVFSYSTAANMSSFYNEYKCDLISSSNLIDKVKMKELEESENISKFYLYSNIKVKFNKESVISTRVIGSIDEFEEYYSMKLIDRLKSTFENDRNVIITKIYSDKYNLKTGDEVILTDKETNKEYSYKVYAISESMINMGDTIYIPLKYGEEDFNIKGKNAALIYSSNPKECKKSLDKVMTSNDDNVSIISDKLAKDKKNSNMIFELFYIFAFMASLIGIIGIVNNLALSIIVRKKEFAIYESLGVNVRKQINMLLLEGIYIGIIGGGFSVIGTLASVPFVQGILFNLGLPIDAELVGREFYLVFALMILIAFIPVLVSIRRVFKRNVIEDIRCE